MSRTESGLYKAIEAELKKSSEPMDCTTLFEKSSIRQHAASVSRVSDYLGNMWRKGEVSRLPAARDGARSSWAYLWKGRRPAPPPSPDQATDFNARKVLLQRPSIEVSEQGNNVVIELPNMVLTIRLR